MAKIGNTMIVHDSMFSLAGLDARVQGVVGSFVGVHFGLSLISPDFDASFMSSNEAKLLANKLEVAHSIVDWDEIDDDPNATISVPESNMSFLVADLGTDYYWGWVVVPGAWEADLDNHGEFIEDSLDLPSDDVKAFIKALREAANAVENNS